VIESDDGKAIWTLCKEFGYTPQEIGDMTHFQVNFLLEGLSKQNQEINREIKRLRRKGK